MVDAEANPLQVNSPDFSHIPDLKLSPDQLYFIGSPTGTLTDPFDGLLSAHSICNGSMLPVHDATAEFHSETMKNAHSMWGLDASVITGAETLEAARQDFLREQGSDLADFGRVLSLAPECFRTTLQLDQQVARMAPEDRQFTSWLGAPIYVSRSVAHRVTHHQDYDAGGIVGRGHERSKIIRDVATLARSTFGGDDLKVVLADDKATARMRTFDQIVSDCQAEGLNIVAVVVGYHCGSRADANGERTSIRGVPIYSRIFRYETPDEMVEGHKKICHGNEYKDLFHYPLSGRSFTVGFRAHEQTLLHIVGELTTLIEEPTELEPEAVHTTLSQFDATVRSGGTNKIIQFIEAKRAIREKELAHEPLKAGETFHVTGRDIQFLFNSLEGPFVLKGFDPDVVDTQYREPVLWPGTQEKSNRLWKELNGRSFIKFSLGQLELAVAHLEAIEGVLRSPVPVSVMPWLDSRSFAKHYDGSVGSTRAIDRLHDLAAAGRRLLGVGERVKSAGRTVSFVSQAVSGPVNLNDTMILSGDTVVDVPLPQRPAVAEAATDVPHPVVGTKGAK